MASSFRVLNINLQECIKWKWDETTGLNTVGREGGLYRTAFAKNGHSLNHLLSCTEQLNSRALNTLSILRPILHLHFWKIRVALPPYSSCGSKQSYRWRHPRGVSAWPVKTGHRQRVKFSYMLRGYLLYVVSVGQFCSIGNQLSEEFRSVTVPDTDTDKDTWLALLTNLRTRAGLRSFSCFCGIEKWTLCGQEG